MIPKEAIKKAMSVGWSVPTHECYDPLNEQPTNFATNEEIALDPSFWQSLGKALGWQEDRWFEMGKWFCGIIFRGGDTEKFWDELLNV